MRCIGKLLRVKPIARRDVSNKCGVCLIFEIPNIGEVTRTYNLPSEPKKHSCFLVKLLKDLGYWPIGGAVLSSPYLASVYIEEKLKNQTFALVLENSVREKYPWNVVSISAEY